jgi:2-methylcitrate dehydratase PrpD
MCETEGHIEAMANETATLADYVADLKFENIPREVLARAKVLTLDFLGSAIRARRDAESTPALLKMLEALALDFKGNATVFGDNRTWTPAVAALLNGALGHSLDFDDTHADASLHPSAPVVPSAFAVGEMVGASGREVLTAIVAGATESVEGKHGLLVGYTDNAHPDKAVAGLGETYETMKIGVKPYPSCRYTHAALDALIAMRREYNLTSDQVRRVKIVLHRNGITLTGDAATKRHPTSIVGGQFSMFFTGAVALDQGRFGWDDYERLGDTAVDALADKFDVVQDSRLETGRSHPFGACVSITTGDGVYERLNADPAGQPNSFPDAQAIVQKFLTLARPVLNGCADQLADAILSLERFDRIETATQPGRR